tara:strand:- start:143 stop:2575 length:2433 start_codon:yes stop_codon:yes gene_type:complete
MPHSKLKVSQLLWLTLPLLVLFSFTEDDFNQFIITKLNAYRATYPQEKAYLQIDKPYYAQGDTLWFKAYLVESAFHMPDSASTLLYVDLIHQKTGKQYLLQRVRLSKGLGHGDIVLGNSIPAGAYTLRGYTNWMENSSSNFFFRKNIYVFDHQEQQLPVQNLEAFDLQFFPESGHLVDGLTSRITYKAVGTDGLGIGISGYVLNKNGDTLSAFKTDYLGMGRMPFVPDLNERYTIIAKTATGRFQEVAFPKIEPFGLVMIVDNVTFADKMRVLIYNKSREKLNKNVYIVGHSRGVLAFSTKAQLSERGLVMNLPSSELPDGITHITVFDESYKPVCERLVFVDNNKNLQVKINTDKPNYPTRAETTVDITIKDHKGAPMQVPLSASVVDLGQVAVSDYEEHIKSYLLLSSDLKGNIETPAYYFDTTHADRKIFLDFVMASNGWSRFHWADVLKDSLALPEKLVENGITLSGMVTKGNRNIKESMPISIIFNKDSLSGFTTTETDVTGRFTVYGLDFTDSLSVRLQGMNKKGNQNLNFSIDPPYMPEAILVKTPFYPITVGSEQLKAFLNQADAYQNIERQIRANRERLLDAVTIKGRKTVENDSRRLYSNADASVKVTPQMAASARSVLDLLMGRVAGVQVQGSGFNASVYIRGNQGEPQFVLDGSPVDKDLVMSLSVSDIDVVEVLKGASAAIYGGRGGNGVISILTKRGNENYDYSKDPVLGVLVTKIKGYDVPRDFYAPRYNIDTPFANRPDFRSTLFWTPNLFTDSNGTVQFKYFNSDAHTKVLIRVDALSREGTPGASRYIYQVN